MNHLVEVCLHLVEIGHFTSSRGNLYYVDSWDELDGFYITSEETQKVLIRSEVDVFRYMSSDSPGYPIFKAVLPEYFI